MIETVRLDIAHRHHFDEGNIDPAVMRPADHVLDFILVHALERNGIEFDGYSCRLGGVNACKHLVEVTPSRDFPKLRRIKRVERHIDPANTAISQFGRIFAKL